MVNFIVENKTSRDLYATISIRATRSKYLGKAQVFDLVGEKILNVKLHSEETRRMEELFKLKLDGRVDSINVNAWEPK